MSQEPSRCLQPLAPDRPVRTRPDARPVCRRPPSLGPNASPAVLGLRLAVARHPGHAGVAAATNAKPRRSTSDPARLFRGCSQPMQSNRCWIREGAGANDEGRTPERQNEARDGYGREVEVLRTMDYFDRERLCCVGLTCSHPTVALPAMEAVTVAPVRGLRDEPGSTRYWLQTARRSKPVHRSPRTSGS